MDIEGAWIQVWLRSLAECFLQRHQLDRLNYRKPVDCRGASEVVGSAAGYAVAHHE